MNVIIQFRRGTAAEWVAANPTLALGEVGYETDTTKIKIGDGSAAWNSLGYSTFAEVQSTTSTDLDGFLVGDGTTISAVNTIDGGEPSSTF